MLISYDSNKIIQIVRDIVGGIQDKRFTTCAYSTLGVFDSLHSIVVGIRHAGSLSITFHHRCELGGLSFDLIRLNVKLGT